MLRNWELRHQHFLMGSNTIQNMLLKGLTTLQQTEEVLSAHPLLTLGQSLQNSAAFKPRPPYPRNL